MKVLIWQGSKDGSKNRNKPEQLPRPEEQAEEQKKIDEVQDRANEFLERQRRKARMRAEIASGRN